MSNEKTRSVFVWEDKSTWVNVEADFNQHYSHIRGYHGCRPLDIESYYKNGFVQPKKKMLCEHAVFILEDKWNSKDDIKALFNKAWKDYYGKGIYFGLSKKFLLDNCGHYLIYGSELICSIGRELGLDRTLMSNGTPTMFSVDIPINFIDENTILELKDTIKSNRRYKTPPDIDFGFCVTQVLLPNLISGCEHPYKIHDPLNCGTYYSYNGGLCDER